MQLRTLTRKPPSGSPRPSLVIWSVRAALAALLGCGLLAATAFASFSPTRVQLPGATTTVTTTSSSASGSSTSPKGAWMTFEANPVSFILRPLRKFAACVRRHGITGLHDPKVVDGKVVLMLPRGLTPKSPQLKKAQHACRKLLPEGANTQPGTGSGPTTTRPGSR
jgi:hypothetical protein